MKTIKPRNPVARSPLMRKGGVHQKSNGAKRKRYSRQVHVAAENWREELEFLNELKKSIDDDQSYDAFFMPSYVKTWTRPDNLMNLDEIQ